MSLSQINRIKKRRRKQSDVLDLYLSEILYSIDLLLIQITLLKIQDLGLTISKIAYKLIHIRSNDKKHTRNYHPSQLPFYKRPISPTNKRKNSFLDDSDSDDDEFKRHNQVIQK